MLHEENTMFSIVLQEWAQIYRGTQRHGMDGRPSPCGIGCKQSEDKAPVFPVKQKLNSGAALLSGQAQLFRLGLRLSHRDGCPGPPFSTPLYTMSQWRSCEENGII